MGEGGWAATASSWCPAPGRGSVAEGAAEHGLLCMAGLSSGCFYFQGELISSACAGVRFFFFPPVTKSWKTPLNNISKHSWNKDRAQGESSNKPRDNQSCCCSLTSPTGGPDSPGEAHSGPSSFPHAGALSEPASGQGLGSEGSRLAQTDCQEHSQGKGWREARS